MAPIFLFAQRNVRIRKPPGRQQSGASQTRYNAGRETLAAVGERPPLEWGTRMGSPEHASRNSLSPETRRRLSF